MMYRSNKKQFIFRDLNRGCLFSFFRDSRRSHLTALLMHNRAHKVSTQQSDKRIISGARGAESRTAKGLAAPQGFEPQYAAPEAAVLPLNEGAVRGRSLENNVLD